MNISGYFILLSVFLSSTMASATMTSTKPRRMGEQLGSILWTISKVDQLFKIYINIYRKFKRTFYSKEEGVSTVKIILGNSKQCFNG